MRQPPQPARMRRERQHFRQHRQSFLRRRGGGRPFAEKRTHRLALPVQSRAQVDPTFVDFQAAELRAA